jgi:hypothetical protein
MTHPLRGLAAILALAMGLALNPDARAALIDRGGGLVYDDVLDVTWLRDASYARTTGYVTPSGIDVATTNGRMAWGDARGWAAQIRYEDPLRSTAWTDWRLPSALNPDGSGPCKGSGCMGSELGHMFYVNLGGTAGVSITTSHNESYSLFTGLAAASYWTETGADDSSTWAFRTYSGNQNTADPSLAYFAWAVRDGDVGPALFSIGDPLTNPITTPLPPAAVLLGSALFGLGHWTRRRPARTRQHPTSVTRTAAS